MTIGHSHFMALGLVQSCKSGRAFRVEPGSG